MYGLPYQAAADTLPPCLLPIWHTQVDLDGNHTLDFQEFLTATVFLGKLERHENLIAAFQRFDLDRSGFITQDELLEVGGVFFWGGGRGLWV